MNILEINDNDKSIRFNAAATYLTNLTNQIIELRNSANQILVFTSGASILILGWYLSKVSTSVPVENRYYYIIMILFLYAASFWQLKVLEKYLKSMAKVVKSIDHIFKAHDKEIYHQGTLLPDDWKDFGQEHWKEPVFFNGKIFLSVVSAISIILIILIR